MGKGMAGNQKGGVIIVFALLLTALLGFVALGMEVGTWYLMRAEMSKAVDAAALAGAVNIASPNVNLAALAQDFADENFRAGYLGTPSSGSGTAAYAASSTATQMTVTGRVSAIGLISRLFGVASVPVSATGVAQKNKAQIMMVLDCSGSMQGTPIANLKTAAGDQSGFLSFFSQADQTEDMMGLVTFSTAAAVKVPLKTSFVGDIQAVINSISAGGATNAEDAIAQAGAQLPDQTGVAAADRYQQFIVFFTDGEPTAFRDTFVNGGKSYDAVTYATSLVDSHGNIENQWYNVGTYLASPTTGNDLSVNAIPTGNGAENSSCKISGNPTLYSTSWSTAFSEDAPPSPYSSSYCDSSIPVNNVNNPRTTLATYIHNAGEQMALNNAASLKARGVMIYTIGLEGDGGIDTTFLSNLSSGTNFAYVAPDSSQLQAIFNLIAKDITLRLVQ